jgi:hypothetical protein
MPHVFLTSAIDGGECSTSHCGRFILTETATGSINRQLGGTNCRIVMNEEIGRMWNEAKGIHISSLRTILSVVKT